MFLLLCEMQNVRLAKVALRPGAGNMVNGILRKLVVLKVFIFVDYICNAYEWGTVKNYQIHLMFGLQENETFPLPKVEGDDRAQARALATLYSHPVVSV